MREDTPGLRLRSVAELLGERFFVPSYQRGYRWTPKQVTALLDDLEAFLFTDPPRDSYYCLQPVVVRRRDDGSWELVDGQQRLTTIHLLLGCLSEVAQLLGKKPFGLQYETREGSADYLAAPDPTLASTNVDYHHMFRAREAIASWFNDRDGSARIDILKCLTQPSDRGANVRVIWYELGEEQDPRAVFIRLNVGRIPLTSAELIRALFLRGDGATDEEVHRRHRIAQDWDLVEKRLHDSEYWFFLQSGAPDHDPPARIEYLFGIFVRVHQPEFADHPDDLATFFAFQAWLDGQEQNIYESWLTFRRQTAQVLEEWFEDRVLFHLVGALVAVAPSGRSASARVLVELLGARMEKTATEFDRFLRGMAWSRFLGQAKAPLPADEGDLEVRLDERLESLQYDRTGPGPLRTALLLFNVAGLLGNRAPTQRFRFDGFKQHTWDIEHIRSVTEYIPAAPARRRSWLEHARDFVDSPAARARDGAEAAQLLQRIDQLLVEVAPDKDGFEEVFTRVRALSGEGEARESDNGLSNLALLDMGTNRSYKNAIFPVKRRRIIELDRDGVYVPPGTRNVFLKYYNPEAAQLLLWDGDDQAEYGRAQRQALLEFFRPVVEDTP
ncbi:MAG: DUF262 domain-containing protein [Haliangiales bacterium]